MMRFLASQLTSFLYLNILFWIILSCIVYLIMYPLGSSAAYVLTRTLVFTGIGFVFSCFYHLLYRAVLQAKSIPVSAAGTFLFCVVFGTVWIYLLEFITWFVLPQAAEMELLWKYGAKASLNNAFVLIAWCLAYTGVRHWENLKEEQQRAAQATALAREAQLQLLHYQLNPHFLFNALNSVRRLVEENPQAAREMITQLSEFLRYSMQEVQGKYTTLSRELECVENYLAIEKIRFEEKINVVYSIEESTGNLLVPGYLLMPLVENAVKHGGQTSSDPLEIHIGAQLNNGDLQLTVRNSGRWVETSSANKSSTGLANLRQRLEQLLPGRHNLEVADRQGTVEAVVKIAVPGAHN